MFKAHVSVLLIKYVIKEFTCSSSQTLAYEYVWPNFEKQDGPHKLFLNGHEEVLHIMRLFHINRKLNLFIVDILIDTCVLYENLDFSKFWPPA